MSLRQKINRCIKGIIKANEARTKKHKQNMLKQLAHNLHVKKETKEENQGLIDRYTNAKPQGLTPMQQAMKDALS